MAHINHLFKPLIKTGGMTMVSRVLGFMRDVALSALLGASPVMDAFLIAFRFPNIFRSLFAEGAFSSAFVPLFVGLRRKSKGNEKTAIAFAAGVGIKLFLLLLLFTLLVIIFMPEIMWGVAPGFRGDPSRMAMVVTFGRISFPYLLAMSLAALFAGVLQSHGLFWRGSLAASFLNICLIAAAAGIILVRGTNQDMMPDVVEGKILCAAVIISGMWQAWYMWRGVKGLYENYFDNKIKKIWQQNQQQIVKRKFPPEEKKLLKTMAPSMVGAGGQQLNSLVSDMIATTVGVGAVTHLFYADRLVQLPLGVIGIALGLVLLQRFSHAQHSGAAGRRELQPLLQQGLCLGLAFALPCMLALHFLSNYFISFMFQRGAFDALASQRTASALDMFAFALPFYILNKVFQPYFYAKGDTKTPVRIILLSFVINGAVAFFLTRNMGMAERGIATASLVAAGFTCSVFFFILFYQRALPLTLHFWSPVLLLFLMNIPLLIFYNVLPRWLAMMGGVWEKNWLLVVTAIVGSAIYYVPALWLYRKNFHLVRISRK